MSRIGEHWHRSTAGAHLHVRFCCAEILLQPLVDMICIGKIHTAVHTHHQNVMVRDGLRPIRDIAEFRGS